MLELVRLLFMKNSSLELTRTCSPSNSSHIPSIQLGVEYHRQVTKHGPNIAMIVPNASTTPPAWGLLQCCNVVNVLQVDIHVSHHTPNISPPANPCEPLIVDRVTQARTRFALGGGRPDSNVLRTYSRFSPHSQHLSAREPLIGFALALGKINQYFLL